MEKKREPGFYWVKFNDEWMIGEYNESGGSTPHWGLTFSEEWFDDEHFSEIDERPITRYSQPPRV